MYDGRHGYLLWSLLQGCFRSGETPGIMLRLSQYHLNKIYDDILQWFNFHSLTQTPIGMIKN